MPCSKVKLTRADDLKFRVTLHTVDVVSGNAPIEFVVKGDYIDVSDLVTSHALNIHHVYCLSTCPIPKPLPT
jgi:hypothetical protein